MKKSVIHTPAFREQAAELHQKNFVADAHYDLLNMVLAKRLKGQTRVIERDYLPELKAGGVDLVVSSLFVESEYLPEMGLRRTLDQISALYSEMEESPGLFSLCRTTGEIRKARARGELAIMLSFEGLDPIGNDLSLLRIFYELGVRGVGITWSRRNYVADGCLFEPREEGRKGGLTEFGVKTIKEAARLGMYLDISHLNDEGVEDLLGFHEGPLMASHSNCRELAPVMRNLTDEQILTLAERGGMMGMNVCSAFVGDSASAKMTEKDLALHVNHIRDLVGIEHVGFGFDFCDEFRDTEDPESEKFCDCINGHSSCMDLTAELLSMGYEAKDVVKVMGGNLFHFLEKTIG